MEWVFPNMSRPTERNARRKERAQEAKKKLEAMFAYTAFYESVSIIADPKRNGYKLRIMTFSDHPPPFAVPTEIDGIEVIRHEAKLLRPR